jgi:hypothetical protein
MFKRYELMFERYKLMFERYKLMFERYKLMFERYELMFERYELMFERYKLMFERYEFRRLKSPVHEKTTFILRGPSGRATESFSVAYTPYATEKLSVARGYPLQKLVDNNSIYVYKNITSH